MESDRSATASPMGSDRSARHRPESRPDSILMDWRFNWEYYRGRVKVIGANSEVIFGHVLKCFVNGDDPVMKIKTDENKTIFRHPRNVWPSD